MTPCLEYICEKGVNFIFWTLMKDILVLIRQPMAAIKKVDPPIPLFVSFTISYSVV